MALMLGVTRRLIPRNFTRGGQTAVHSVLLHIMEGTLDGTDSWFRNPDSRASSHFGVGRDGRIFQWVDTGDRSWHPSGANALWLSIEHEGRGGDALTSPQLVATARVIRWMHETEGVKLQLADTPAERGIGWHGMGGKAWGSHPDCPGNPIKAQRPAIIAAARGTEETDMNLTDAVKLPAWVPTTWPKDEGLQDGKITVNTALGSTYGHARRSAENSAQLVSDVQALRAAFAELFAQGRAGG
ncbi:N-acetylmuramoyl-L-alanine amidase [Streptomyces sp. NP-1717]|uniref:N-acetylmuramoyl-L-alanine amidase n=1 Tax=Streptomyces sp. NP-1717 TaxID=2704470 RepID=UPI001F5CEAEF|nr:N-acetylmuramoyl-L-alanine amidase [Streptomyces sp. NP-1717]MCI3221992.1 N-acetylmuramoyl-L-alanine amidase [Streptomyces sp. NP-1717]